MSDSIKKSLDRASACVIAAYEALQAAEVIVSVKPIVSDAVLTAFGLPPPPPIAENAMADKPAPNGFLSAEQNAKVTDALCDIARRGTTVDGFRLVREAIVKELLALNKQSTGF